MQHFICVIFCCIAVYAWTWWNSKLTCPTGRNCPSRSTKLSKLVVNVVRNLYKKTQIQTLTLLQELVLSPDGD